MVQKLSQAEASARPAYFPLLVIAAAVTLLHLLTNQRYGFHRDELQFLSDARHMAWGFVAYPPFTPFVERVSLHLFGLSLVGLRLASVLAQALAILLTGLMAFELRGGRLSQIAAALAVALSPLPLFEGTEFQYTTFDYLWWVLAACFVIRLLTSEDPRWWLALGTVAGLGLMTKYTMLFCAAGILCGFLFTPARRYLRTRWFPAAVALTLLITLPNLLWQAHHHFISYYFLHHIHVRDVGEGRARGFLRNQLWVCTNVYAVPLWITGLVWCLRNPRYRPIFWMYLVPFALLLLGDGLFYYLAAAYPVLIAAGASAAEHGIRRLPRRWPQVVTALFFLGLSGAGLYSVALVIPLASSGPLRSFALAHNDTLREEIGWNDLIRTVAAIRNTLPEPERSHIGIVTGNYGEQGAIEILGPAAGLPPPISMTNSAWLRGYPVPPPTTLIVIGFSAQAAEESFTACRLAGHNGNPDGIRNEESEDHPGIFLCGAPRQPWPEFWRTHQNFG